MLNLKTIVNLREEKNMDASYTSQRGINSITFKVKDKHEPSLEDAEAFLKLILDESNYPILFHCEHGHGRTSTFSVLAKLALGWDVNAAIHDEEERFHYSFYHECQRDFLIKNFSEWSKKM